MNGKAKFAWGSEVLSSPLPWITWYLTDSTLGHKRTMNVIDPSSVTVPNAYIKLQRSPSTPLCTGERGMLPIDLLIFGPDRKMPENSSTGILGVENESSHPWVLQRLPHGRGVEGLRVTSVHKALTLHSSSPFSLQSSDTLSRAIRKSPGCLVIR
jgi:hypothetical protein